jgi:hypothetical protein
MKTKRIQWNDKRCAEKDKISGEIRKKMHTTRHDKTIRRKKCSGVRLVEKVMGLRPDVLLTSPDGTCQIIN